MLTLLTFVHLLVAIFICIFVLLQDSKGGALGMGGGGSNTVFGTTGAGNFLNTTTKWLGIIFAVTCLTLAYLTTHQNQSAMDNFVDKAAPAQTAPAQTAPTEGEPAKETTPPSP